MHKKIEGVESWNLKITGAAEDVPRSLIAFGKGCGGHLMFVSLPRSDESLLIQTQGKGKEETAKKWRTDLGLGPSHHAEIKVEIAPAVAALRDLKAKTPAAGPAVLKGQWSGKLVCADGAMHVELARKVVSYGSLALVSGKDGRWTATFTREKRWFTGAAAQSVTRSGLAETIKAGMGLVIGLVSEACSTRDTSRPPKAAAKGGPPVDAVAQAERKLEAARAKAAKPKFPKAPAKPRKTTDEQAEAFLAKRAKAVPTLKSVKVEKPCPTCVDGMVKAVSGVKLSAGRLGAGAVKLDDVKDAPEHLTRAANLIRRAGVLLDSPLCKGQERTGAADALRGAIAAYNKARGAYVAAKDGDIALATSLQKIAEKVALAAAKIGRSCQAGQQALPLPGKAPKAAPAKAVNKKTRKAGADGKPAPRQPNAYMLWAVPRIAAIIKAKGVTRKEAMVLAGAEWQAKKAAGTTPAPKASPGKARPSRGTTAAKPAKAARTPKGGNAAKDAKILQAVKGSLKDLAAELRAGGA